MTNHPSRLERILCLWGCVAYPAVIYGIILLLILFGKH